MAPNVTVHSDGPAGVVQAISIEKTAPEKATIAFTSDQGASTSERLKNVRADPANLTLACELDGLFVWGNIQVVVTHGAQPVATITVSGAIAYNGTHVFPLRAGDDVAISQFLHQANFPSLA